MSGHAAGESRTQKIEGLVAHLCGVPLTAETVFLRPTRQDRPIEKEVCDVLLALRTDAILIALKSQEDPNGRAGAKLASWCTKHATKAVSQLGGAIRAIGAQPFWCDHSRRGRVDFPSGGLQPRHALAILETLQPEVVLSVDVPDECHGVPITYISLNDALSLIDQVRAFPDLVDYFSTRLTLPTAIRRTIGRESLLYQWYLLNESRFRSPATLADIEAWATPRNEEFRRRLEKKAFLDRFAPLVEQISDALATRRPDAADGCGDGSSATFRPGRSCSATRAPLPGW